MEAEELWPSLDAVVGPKAGKSAAETVRAGGGPAGLVRTLRAAQAADGQSRMMSGGGALGEGAGLLQGRQWGVGDSDEDRGDGDDSVPYVDLVLKVRRKAIKARLQPDAHDEHMSGMPYTHDTVMHSLPPCV